MFHVKRSSIDKEKKHVELVIEANKTVNLTRIASPESAMLFHIEDSLAALPEVDEAPAGPAADIGSGAGFPGIPLAIETGRDFLLVESVGKKVKVLDDIIEKLDLEDSVSTYNGRIEDLGRISRGAFSLVTARALASLNSLIELASPLLFEGGHLVAYKSGEYQGELYDALRIQEKVGMKHISTRAFLLSDGKTHRSIIVFQRSGNPSVKLPRRSGMAQKNPYR